MILVQQIVYTAQPERWHRLAAGLGLEAPYPPSADWAEFDGDGVLAVHRVGEGRAPGSVDLHLLVDDLDAVEKALADFAVERGTMDDVGPILRVREGIGFSVSEGVRALRKGPLVIEPIWFTPAQERPRAALEAAGVRPDVAADSGGWVSLRADGGSVGLHGGAERIGLSFSFNGDVDVLAERLRAAGFDAAVIDESYARTIRIPDPDGGDEIWINGPYEDMYGYRRFAGS